MEQFTLSEENRESGTKSLVLLGNLIVKEIGKLKEGNKLLAYSFEKVPVKSVDYAHDSYTLDYANTEVFDHFEWPWELQADFQDQIRKSVEFETASELIANAFNTTKEIVMRYSLARFLQYIISNGINGAATEDWIKDVSSLYIDDLLCELTHKKYTWHVKAWLRNLSVESEELLLFLGVQLRRPSKNELTLFRQKQQNRDQFSEMGGKRLPASSILCFSILAGKAPTIAATFSQEITDEIEVWLNVLRLFRPGDVAIHYLDVQPNSIIECRATQAFAEPQDKLWKGKLSQEDTAYYNYSIQKSEEKALKKFAEIMKKPLQGILPTSYLKGNAYDLALHRYCDALLKTEVKAYKILNAITALEALLTNGEPEITFKISLRVANLLRIFNLNGKKIQVRIKNAYNLRSKLVHGSSVSAKKKDDDLLEFANENTHRIINYTRLCVIIMLQIRNTKSKDDVITLLNDSLVDESRLKELVDLVKNNTYIPVIKPFINDLEE